MLIYYELSINELRYALRQPIVWLSVCAPALFGWLLSQGMGAVDEDIVPQFQLTLIILQMMTLPIAAGVLAPVLLYRDRQCHMDEFIGATPVSRFKLDVTRTVSLLILLSCSACLSFFTVVATHWQDAPQLGPLSKAALVQLVVLIIPNALLLAAVALGLYRFVSVTASYVVFAGLWMGYLLLASVTGNPMLAGSQIISDALYQAMLWLDPFGFTAFIQSASLSQAASTQALLINRLLVVVFAVAGVYCLAKSPSQSPVPATSAFVPKATARAVAPLAYAPVLCQLHPVRQFIYLVRDSLWQMLRQRVTLAVLLIWPLLVFNSVGSSADYVEPFSQRVVTSLDAVNTFAFDMLPLLGSFLCALWSWQICRVAAQEHFSQLIAATRISNQALLGVHVLTLCSLVLLLILMSLVGAVATQIILQSPINLGDYLVPLASQGLSLLLIGTVFVAIQHLFASPLLACAVVGLALIERFSPLMTYFGLTHTFWNLAWTPLQPADAFWGYSASVQSYWPYVTVWLVFSTALLLLATTFSHRGVGTAQTRLRWRHAGLLIPCAVSVTAFVSLHQQLVAERPLYNSHLREAFKVDYEQTLKPWQQIAQPQIAHIDASVDFYPSKKHADFALTYTLINNEKVAIERVLVGRAAFYGWAEVRIEGASQTDFYPRLNQAVYTFNTPMLPGERRTLDTDFSFHQPTLWPAGGHQFVSEQMSYLRAVPLIPTVGYQPNYELSDVQLRRVHGLPANNISRPSTLFADGNVRFGGYDWLTMTSKVTTELGYQVLTQGQLLSSSVQNNRTHYLFKTQSAFRAIPAWITLPVEPEQRQYEGVTLQVFAPPAHPATDLHLQAMQDTVVWFKNNIVAYQGKRLSLVAMPNVGFTGYALPQMMLINHQNGFNAKPTQDAGFDQRYRRAVHETAHQWFGHDIGNGVAQDQAFLVESLAKYIELVLIEQRYGITAAAALVAYEQRRYDRARNVTHDQQLALIDATENHQQYSQATLVFAELRALLGDEVIAQALRKLWREHRYPKLPANAMDFVRYLKHYAAPAQREAIRQLILEPDRGKLLGHPS